MEQKIKIICKGNQVIECDARLIQFSDELQQQSNQNINFQFDEVTLRKIIEFYEQFNYDNSVFKLQEFKKKITSNILDKNLPKMCIQFLQPWIINENKLNLDALTELTEASYQYNFKALKKMLIKAIGTQFYCGKTEQEIDEFKEKFQLPVVIDPSEQERIMNVELKDIFDNLNEKLNQQFTENPPILNNITKK